MDLATVIGYLLAWGALMYSMWHATHGAMGAYFVPAELLLGADFGQRNHFVGRLASQAVGSSPAARCP